MLIYTFRENRKKRLMINTIDKWYDKKKNRQRELLDRCWKMKIDGFLNIIVLKNYSKLLIKNKYFIILKIKLFNIKVLERVSK